MADGLISCGVGIKQGKLSYLAPFGLWDIETKLIAFCFYVNFSWRLLICLVEVKKIMGLIKIHFYFQLETHLYIYFFEICFKVHIFRVKHFTDIIWVKNSAFLTKSLEDKGEAFFSLRCQYTINLKPTLLKQLTDDKINPSVS